MSAARNYEKEDTMVSCTCELLDLLRSLGIEAADDGDEDSIMSDEIELFVYRFVTKKVPRGKKKR